MTSLWLYIKKWLKSSELLPLRLFFAYDMIVPAASSIDQHKDTHSKVESGKHHFVKRIGKSVAIF